MRPNIILSNELMLTIWMAIILTIKYLASPIAFFEICPHICRVGLIRRSTCSDKITNYGDVHPPPPCKRCGRL